MSAITHTRPTIAEINLDNLASNFHASKQFIGSDVKYLAVVKADAYGHGAVECAKRLEREGIDWFGVAIPEEGVELRRSGIELPILCLGSFWQGQEQSIIEHNLTPVVFDETTATNLQKYCEARGTLIDVHVKIDTGAGRVGVRHDAAAEFVTSIKSLKNIRVTGLLTHFAAAENPNETEFTNLQISRFKTVCDAFRNAGHSPEIIDLANSPGAIAHPASRGNMVRLGGALYGLLDDILPPETARPELKGVLSLHSRIVDIKRVPTGESLGYGRTFVTKRDSKIALVPIGYADGYPRTLSNRGKACVRGCSVPVVGRISMDWTLFDVTDVPDVAENDEIILIGGDIGAADLARETGTIGYEITCGISQRVPRIFIGSRQ